MPDNYKFTYKGKDRSIPLDIPKEKENDPKFLEDTIQNYIDTHPEFGSETSARKGSLKVAPPAGIGEKVLGAVADTLGYPVKSIMQRYAGQDDNPDTPTWRKALGGAEDTAASAFDLASGPGLVRGGFKGLWPAVKAAAGYTAGSKAVESGMNTLGAPPEVSRGAGMIAGTGTGLLASSPKIAAKAQSGLAASKDQPIGRYSSPGAMIGYGAGTAIGHGLGVPVPYATTGPVGASIGAKAPAFLGALSTPNEAPAIDPLFTGKNPVAKNVPIGNPQADIDAMNAAFMSKAKNAASVPIKPVPMDASRGLPAPSLVTPPPADTSFVRAQPVAPHQVNMRPALPPSSAPYNASPGQVMIPDIVQRPGPMTGRMIEAGQQPPIGGPHTVGYNYPSGNVKPINEVPQIEMDDPSGVKSQDAAKETTRGAKGRFKVVYKGTPKESTKKTIDVKPVEAKTEIKEKEDVPSKKAEETKVEPTKAEESKPEGNGKEEAKDAKPNSEKLKSKESAEIVLNHNLSIADPTWDGEQVSYAHLKKAADLTGSTATALGRKLQELGYDVEPVARGYGLRPSKKDLPKKE